MRTETTGNGWANFGDVSPWHGQTWLRQAGDDFAEVVEIISSCDLDTLADNQIRLEFGTVYVPQSWDDWQPALECVGFEFNGPPCFFELALALCAYWGFDRDTHNPATIVQFGKEMQTDMVPDYIEPEVADVTLHGNSTLENYVDELLNGKG